jgi:hypothetical protein
MWKHDGTMVDLSTEKTSSRTACRTVIAHMWDLFRDGIYNAQMGGNSDLFVTFTVIIKQ